VTPDDDSLWPPRHQPRDCLADYWLSEHCAAQDVSYGAVRTEPHFLELEFCKKMKYYGRQAINASNTLCSCHSWTHKPQWEAHSLSANQQILWLVWKPVVHYHIHMSLQLAITIFTWAYNWPLPHSREPTTGHYHIHVSLQLAITIVMWAYNWSLPYSREPTTGRYHIHVSLQLAITIFTWAYNWPLPYSREPTTGHYHIHMILRLAITIFTWAYNWPLPYSHEPTTGHYSESYESNLHPHIPFVSDTCQPFTSLCALYWVCFRVTSLSGSSWNLKPIVPKGLILSCHWCLTNQPTTQSPTYPPMHKPVN
jgi:hypothetical protein